MSQADRVSQTDRVPLSVLDLSPRSEGASAGDALRNTLDLARRTEELGFHRYWLAEHHLVPGVVSSAPAVVIALVADATTRIRVGSGAVQMGHHTAVTVAEEFGTLAQIHPGRIDLGLGRPAVDRLFAPADGDGPPSGSDQPAAVSGGPVSGGAVSGGAAPGRAATVVDGLLVPAPPRMRLNADRLRRQFALVGYRPGAGDEYGQQVRDIQAFLRGDYRTAEGEHLTVPAAEGADLQIWVLGSSPGASARTAGELGLPFVANYHVSPSSVLEAVQAYRDAFVPSESFDRPYVMVSADVVVGPDEDTAAELASPYGLWVLSIRSGQGARPFPSPAQAAAYPWTAEERTLVADRVETQFVGGPATVARKLETLRKVTGADELIITTIAHDHADRVRSYELLAGVWQ
ncbi:LLM class flavin-dependent oxidoreductase [Frankia sp. ACN1ag]|uniref:LLM class flavin-dependent oxidoreductase n=1 Tax=Frankia sp. ACN1ag TaxID=102891 RepID=UPI0006DC80E8|nr:LLM class flavin-dependent oxidoreductase [Frankia sp. ACN1ag]KQC40067.1 monooxygenase [Frankia sp. ACN1ag]